MEGNAEAALDQIGHTASRPEVGRETMNGGLLSQPLANLLILFRGKKARATRCRFGGQARVTLASVLCHPFGHRDRMDAKRSGHSCLRLSTENQIHRSPSYSFQFGSRSFASHGDDVT